VSRTVIQRNNANEAQLNIAGRCTNNPDVIEARLVPRAEQSRLDTIVATAWQTVQVNPSQTFTGVINAKGGWYNLELRAMKGSSVIYTATVERVGIGEIFAYIGHSNAQGGAYNQTGPDATDDRVNCIAVGQEPWCMGMYPYSQPATATDSLWCKYLQTADVQYLPLFSFSKVSIQSGIAPFCGKPWFWSIVGDSLSRKWNVPIFLYGAAFGGTNSEHWYKAAKNIPFTHGFIRYDIRMPYVNLKNILQLYVPLTGIRAVLSLSGVNERNESKNAIKGWMEGYIEQSRLDSKKTDLAWMIALDSYLLDKNQTPSPNPLKQDPRDAQAEVAQQANNFLGPDLDNIIDNRQGQPNSERPDGLHFGNNGLISAANLWVNSLNTTSFRTLSKPQLAQSFLVQSSRSGDWDNLTTWDCNCHIQNYNTVQIKTGHNVNLGTISTQILNLVLQGNLSIVNQAKLGF
jgi:hypothetical protein